MVNVTNSSSIPVASLRVIKQNTKDAFFAIFIIIFILAILGNVFAIWSICKRKCKILQKACIISLAVADILSVTAFTTTTLHAFLHDLMIWTLGDILCHLLPMVQLHATTASSIVLFIIALDRYRNVVYALERRWDTNLYECVFSAIVLWIICAVVAYPMYVYYNHFDVTIIYEDGTKENSHMCVNLSNTEMTGYYCTLCLLIFLPLLATFLWFYYNIAKIVWQHRNPLSLRFKISKQTPKENNNEENLKSIFKKGKNVQVERKIRTFKIILVLMFVFITCRLPYWIYYVLTLFKTVGSSSVRWNIHYALSALNILSCALNPLLYTFLNQTISVLKKIKNFISTVCCCCFTNAEFDDFEKDNPFEVENFEQKRKSQGRTEHPKSSRVKFDDVARTYSDNSQGSGSSNTDSTQKY